MILPLVLMGLAGDLERIAPFHDYAAVGVEETSTERTPKQGSSNETFRVCKRVTTVGPGVEFLLAIPSAARAFELPVECFEFFDLRIKYVLIAFNELPREFRVHLLERHA